MADGIHSFAIDLLDGDLPAWTRVVGASLLGLAIGSLAIPRVLRWRDELARVSPLTREVFWTYAAYIWATNLAMGGLALLRPEWLLSGDGLARGVAGFITAYWGVRLAIQFGSFGRHAPPGRLFLLAEGVLSFLFLTWTLFFGTIALGWIP